MSNISACKVINNLSTIENEEFVVCTEWIDSRIKILIIKYDNSLLVGEVLEQSFVKYAKTFKKTLEVYLKETKDILSGENDGIEFLLESNKFYWKKGKWHLGEILIEPITEVKCLTNFTLLMIDHNSKMKKNILQLEENNQRLKNVYSQLKTKLNEVVQIKEQLEAVLYKKFILLLNAKKSKIRELSDKLKKLENDKESIFNIATDESENESDSKNISSNISNSKIVSIKEKLSEENNKIIERKRRKSDTIESNDKDLKKMKIHTLIKDAEPVASTSNDTNIDDDDETPDFFEESECEIKLQDEEDSEDDSVKPKEKIKINEIIQRSSEEEMFE